MEKQNKCKKKIGGRRKIKQETEKYKLE